jgi:hypothetical protein
MTYLLMDIAGGHLSTGVGVGIGVAVFLLPPADTEDCPSVSVK